MTNKTATQCPNCGSANYDPPVDDGNFYCRTCKQSFDIVDVILDGQRRLSVKINYAWLAGIITIMLMLLLTSM